MIPDRVLDHLKRTLDEPQLDGTRYELLNELGRGATARVWAARDRELGRIVALKVVDQNQNLLEEARTVAQLEHPGIVPLYEAGTLPDGRLYYAMKRIEGARFDLHAKELAIPDRLRLFLKICDAVAYAHSRGVLHRDLKPQNIMVGAFGEAYVMDWGVAVQGTPGFMAPEQASGGPIDQRTDIFALGVMLGDLAPAVPALRAIAKTARAELPADRYPNVAALQKDVTHYLDREAVSVYQEPLLERARRFAARNSTLLMLITAYVLVRFTLFFFRGR